MFAFDVKPSNGDNMTLSVQFARGFRLNDGMDDKSKFAEIFNLDVKNVLKITVTNAGYGRMCLSFCISGG